MSDADLSDEDEADDRGERRDLLGEMEIAARIMITGGEERENAKLTRADRFFIRQAIVDAARHGREVGLPTVRPQEVAEALMARARDAGMPEPRRQRLSEMGEAMMLFTQGLEGHFFNRDGQPWPDVARWVIGRKTPGVRSTHASGASPNSRR